ncbi:MAG: VWA domain-containing protein [Bacteriovoracia bacterium]
MRFLNPHYLWLLLLIVLLPSIWSYLQRKNSLHKFATSDALKILIQGFSTSRMRNRFLLFYFCLFFSILAISRPQYRSHEETLPEQGLDMVFLLDVSNSMLVEDSIPSRLKKAKHTVRTFLDKLNGDRVGIIAFAGSAFPAVPLTTDYEFIRQTLEIIDEKSISNQGTDLSKALQVAVDLLEAGGLTGDENTEQTDSKSSQVIILLSDGESESSFDTKDSKILTEKNIRLYSIGVGSHKGGPIPIRDDRGYLKGYKKEKNGNMVLSKLEPASLETLAKETGGKFYLTSSNEGEVDEIISSISGLERTEGEGRHVLIYDELYQYPLALAVFCLLFFLFIRQQAPIAIFLLLVSSSSWSAMPTTSLKEHRHTEEGIKLYDSKSPEKAINEFGKAQALNPENPIHQFNLGDAYLKAGVPDKAIEQFREVLKNSSDANQAAMSAFNLGKSLSSIKQNEEALQAYQEGLDRLKDDPKANPEIVKKLKQALQQTEQQKTGGGGSDEKEQQKDQKESEEKKNQDDQDQQNKKNSKENEKNKNYQIPKRKPQFKPEKLSENDAKRIIKQLQDQEGKTKQRMMQHKSRNRKDKGKDQKNEQDW